MSLPTRIAALLSAVFGRFTWQRPPWLTTSPGSTSLTTRISGFLHRHARLALALSALGVVAGGVGYWATHRPPPPDQVRLSATTQAPAPPPRRLRTDPTPPPQNLEVQFDGSAAPLELINKPVTAGVSLSPTTEGEWKWSTERTLTFTPKKAWPIGQKYRVSLEPALVARPNVVLMTRELTFETDVFVPQLSSTEFYQDPVDPAVKQVVATFRFNYPVEPQSFEKAVALTSAPRSNATQKASHRVSVSYDDLKFEAYVRSETLPMPLEDHSATITLAAGVKPEVPGAASEALLTGTAIIPGRGNRFHVNNAQVGIARSAEGDPDQVLVFSCTTPVHEKRFADAVKVWLLPKDKPAAQGQPAVKDYRWSSAMEVGPEALKRATRLTPAAIPQEREVGEVQSFKLDVKPASKLFVRVEAGVEAFGGYVLLKPFEAVLDVPEYPRELRIAHEGAVLSVSGDKKLTVSARGLPGVRVRLYRILPKDLNHLLSKAGGDLAHLRLYGSFNEEDISEVFTHVEKLDASDPRAAQYAGIDFGPHLKEGSEQRGLYFVDVEAWDPATDTAITQYTRSDEPAPNAPSPEPVDEGAEAVDRGTEEGASNESQPDEGAREAADQGLERPYGQLSDHRFVLLTDLGVIDKVDAKANHWVYVQSFRSGAPVGGAQLEVLARNGTVVVKKVTDGSGVATLPSLQDFSRERAPVALVVREGSDVSFLPLTQARLDLSRFDVGGVRTRGKPAALTAFAFTDRGLYRPGETAHLVTLVRAVDWSHSVTQVPLELTVVDPRGLVVKRQKVKLDAFGYVSLDFTPEESAPTGTYAFNVSVAEEKHEPVNLGSTTFRVEEFLPDRLRMTTHFVERAAGWVTSTKVTGAVELKNLFGTPAAGHVVQASYALSPWTPSFSRYADYQFFDPARARRSEEQRLEDATTDDTGNATWTVDLSSWAPATYHVTLYAEGMELGGGRSVSGVAGVVVSPRAYLLGFKADGDLGFVKRQSARTVNVIAIGPTLERLKVEKLKAVLVEQRFVSVLARYGSGSYHYQSVLKDVTRKTEALTVSDQGTTLTVASDEVGSFYLSLRDQEDVELLRVPYTIVGEGNLTKDLEKNAELKVSLDKPDYEPGDTISVQMTAPYAGAGVITIERDRVYASKSFKTTTTNSVQTIEVPAELEANGYVHVAFVRAIDSKELYVSPLSYGVVPFSISKKRQQLEVSVKADALARPGRPLAIRYKADRPARVAVYAVDEGILQVAHYETPDPLGFFLARRALEVTTQQIVDQLLPEFSLVHARGKEGGDESAALAKNLNPFKRKADAPAVFWSGIVEAGTDERTVSFDVPESFNGTLRLVAVAAAPTAMGVAQSASVIRGPFVVSPNAPTFASPHDSLVVTAAIANNVEGSGDKAAVTVELAPNASFTVKGPATQTLTIPEGREGVASFEVTATEVLGAGELRFLVSGSKQEVTRTAHLSVRPASPYTVTTQAGTLRDGQQALKPARKMFDQLATRALSLSVLPLGVGSGAVDYLENYPHLCSEQLASRAAPALVFMRRPEWGYEPKKAKAAFERAFDILRARQNESGQFGYWAANSFVSDPLDVSIALMLTEAKDRGAPSPSDVRLKALGELKRLAQEPLRDLGHAQLRAQALYVLARNEIVMPAPTAQLAEYLARAKPESGPAYELAVGWLAGTYRLTNNTERARQLVDRLTLRDTVEPDATYYWDDAVYRAQLLYVFARHFPEKLDTLGPKLLERLVSRLNSLHSLSAAWCLYALDAYATAVEGSTKAGLVHVTLEAQQGTDTWKPVALTGSLVAKARFDAGTTAFRIVAKDGPLVFYSLTEAGFDREPPTQAIQEGVELIHTLEDGAGHEVHRVALGDEVNVHVKTRSLIPGRTLTQMAVVDLLPSGFEVVLNRGSDAQGLGRLVAGGATWSPTELDAREDRVIFYGQVPPSVGELRYRIKAVSKGHFTLPPAYTTGMYEPTVRGRSIAGSIDVE